jgi:hypothetical protein
MSRFALCKQSERDYLPLHRLINVFYRGPVEFDFTPLNNFP